MHNSKSPMNNPAKIPALPATNKKIHVYISLRTGAESFCTGTKSFCTGTESLRTGTKSLRTGTEGLRTGTESLRTGTKSLRTGTKSFRTGTQTKRTVTFFVCCMPSYQSIPPKKVRHNAHNTYSFTIYSF
jgi:RND superfamily putative drug exporter